MIPTLRWLIAKSVLVSSLVILGVLTATHAPGHQDTPIQLGPDGQLRGLPGRFQPAFLHVLFAPNATESRVSSIRLQLGDRRVSVPRCATRLLESPDSTKIRASASWYHQPMFTLPYYLSVTFYQRDYDEKHWANNGVAMFFNLETARLMQMTAEQKEGSDALRHKLIDLAQYCARTELTEFYDPLLVVGTGPAGVERRIK